MPLGAAGRYAQWWPGRLASDRGSYGECGARLGTTSEPEGMLWWTCHPSHPTPAVVGSALLRTRDICTRFGQVDYSRGSSLGWSANSSGSRSGSPMTMIHGSSEIPTTPSAPCRWPCSSPAHSVPMRCSGVIECLWRPRCGFTSTGSAPSGQDSSRLPHGVSSAGPAVSTRARTRPGYANGAMPAPNAAAAPGCAGARRQTAPNRSSPHTPPPSTARVPAPRPSSAERVQRSRGSEYRTGYRTVHNRV